MRVLQLVSQTVLGGAETYGFSLGAELRERGHEVLLLANRQNGPLFDKPRPSGMEVAALARESRLDPRPLTFLLEHLRRFQPDILHAHNFGANTWARVLGNFFPRLGVVCHVHSGRMVTSQPAHRALLDRILFRRADLVIGLNREMMDYLHGRLHVPGEKSVLLPNGIDMDRFRPPVRARERSGVLCVASLTEVKNHRTLIGAWARVVDEVPQAQLTLVGEGSLRPALEAQVREASLGSNVAFAGLQADVLPFLEDASIFVLPSLREALPLALLEAMATGLVPVASAVGGIPEVVADGETGFLVEPGDEAGLAAALTRLLRDPEAAQRMGTAARASVASTYGLAGTVDRLIAAYSAVLARRRG